MRRVLISILVACAIAVVSVAVARDAASLRSYAWQIRPGRLAVSVALEVTLLAWGVFLWSRILASFDGPRPHYRGLLTVWWRSTLAKYLPGAVWSVAATAEMAEGVGGSSVSLPSSFVLQGSFTLVGALGAALVLGGAGQLASAGLSVWGVGALFAGSIVLVHPTTVNRLVSTGARLARRQAPVWRGSWGRGGALLGLYAATWVAYGLAFALFFSAITPSSSVDWTRLAAINALAFAAGFIALFAPGGFGVREAALVGLLAPIVPAVGPRVLIAAASRVWLVSTEALAGGAVIATRRRRRVTGSAVPAGPKPTSAPAQVSVLTDSRLALNTIADACRGAQRSIRIAQLAFDADCTPIGEDVTPLLDILLSAAQRPVDPVDVRVLLNGGLLLDTTPALRAAIRQKNAADAIAVRTVRAFPQVMHTKIVVVDDHDAFVMGSSLVNGYWDSARHYATGDPAASAGYGERPLHDVAARIRGAGAEKLSQWFDKAWTATPSAASEPARFSGPVINAPSCGEADRGQADRGEADREAEVHVVSTIPRRSFAGDAGCTEILDEYLAAIANARSSIYLESQYFSARPIARAVAAALVATPALEVIIVLNQNPDVSGYRAWQNARLTESGLIDHPRVGVFALWSAIPSRAPAGGTEVTQVFVHSKVSVIDDAWATIGTANLDGASLHSYGDDFGGSVGRTLFGRHRNFDLNIAVGGGGIASHPVASTLRRELWSQHLGVTQGQLATRPVSGWLPLWRAAAATNVERLRTGAVEGLVGRVLQYVLPGRPASQLRAMGVDPASAGLKLQFDPSMAEVLWSPGWLKRVIPNIIHGWTG